MKNISPQAVCWAARVHPSACQCGLASSGPANRPELLPQDEVVLVAFHYGVLAGACEAVDAAAVAGGWAGLLRGGLAGAALGLAAAVDARATAAQVGWAVRTRAWP
jgi:hypothetical protein